MEKQLESVKHHLWNGNVGPAQTAIDVLKLLVEAETMSPERKKLLKAVEDFAGYIAANQDFIPDYGNRYRNDETITTDVRRVGGESGGEQAICKEAANEVDAAGSALAAPSTSAGAQ